MEYNKDEAQRAEAKIVAQEQQLSQMNAVLDVFMAAQNKVNGQTDWYGILQVDVAADEAHIKKQYRKLALLLHPKKNKCAGAEGAFKIIGEAWGVLSDKAKRSVYDHKRTAGDQQFKIQKPPKNGYEFAKPNITTFWTACLACKMQYEYPRMYINHNLLCPNCQQPYMAFEIPGFHRNGVRVSAAFRPGGFSGMAPNLDVNNAGVANNANQNKQRTNASNGVTRGKKCE